MLLCTSALTPRARYASAHPRCDRADHTLESVFIVEAACESKILVGLAISSEHGGRYREPHAYMAISADAAPHELLSPGRQQLVGERRPLERVQARGGVRVERERHEPQLVPPDLLQPVLDRIPKDRGSRPSTAETGLILGGRRFPDTHPWVGLRGSAAELDQLLVATPLIDPNERAMLAIDLERIGLARCVPDLESLSSEAVGGPEVAPHLRPGRDGHMRNPAQRGLAECRCQLLVAIPRALSPREVARFEADLQQEVVRPELQCAILRRLRAGEQILGQHRPLCDHVGTPQAVERVLQHARPDPRVANLSRERNRLGGQRLPPCAVVLVEQLLRLQREQLWAPTRISALVEFERSLDRIDPRLVELADGARETARVGQSGVRSQPTILERRSNPRRLQQRLTIRRIAGQLLGPPEPDQRTATLGILDRAEQPQRVENCLTASAGARLSSACQPAREA